MVASGRARCCASCGACWRRTAGCSSSCRTGAGLWARVDTTPFGYGSPFSRSQLTKLLKDAMFSPEDWQYALYMPPFTWRVLLKWPVFWERLGLVLWPAFSGVIMVEATKQIYAAVPVREVRARSRRIVPCLPASRRATPHPSRRAFGPPQDEVNPSC